MKKIKLIIFIFILLFCQLLISSCKNNFIDDEKVSTEQIYKKWYGEVIDGFKQKVISKSVSDDKAVSEYRIIYNVALQRYDYYSLKIFSDGTGKFTYMVHKSEDFSKGEIILKETRELSKQETKSIYQVIIDNDFYNIPTIHPDDNTGCDGTTIFVEGFDGKNEHLIKMWMPDDTYEISIIHNAFADFADTIAERPKIRFD